MRLLLDTHALLWWLADDDALGSKARALISDSRNETLISVVSLWEIVVKIRVGKLEADIEEIITAVSRDGLILLTIRPAHLLQLEKLPMHHRDPFDHLLIAQALGEDASFVSEDRHARLYMSRVVACANGV